MKKSIKEQLKIVIEEENFLYAEVCQLSKSDEECNCEKSKKYDFRNIIPVEETTILCLNCGGYIEYNEEDWL